MAKKVAKDSVYITTTLNREYLIGGILIPKKVYSKAEKEAGRTEIVEVSAAAFEKLKADAIFKNHLSNGNIVVLDNKPDWAKSQGELLADKEATLLAELDQEMKNAKAFYDSFGDVDVAALKNELAELKIMSSPEAGEKMLALEEEVKALKQALADKEEIISELSKKEKEKDATKKNPMEE